MAGRARTTKKLSQRIDREYFKRLYPIPRWRRILSIGLSVIGLGWVAWSSFAGTGEVFNAGPLAKKHHLLEGNCTSCHVAESGFGRSVTQQACLNCHDGPVHKEQQLFEPACTSCHIEHRGSFQLASVTDSSCSQCHGSLQTKGPQSKIYPNITAFDGGHPEFRLLMEGMKDPGTVKLNHEVHLKADLRGPNAPTQLQCSACHVRAENGAMAPVNFEDHCASCHPLEFHRKISDVLPHEKPDIVLAFARESFQKYIAANPGDVNIVDPPLDPRIMTARPGPAGSAAVWIQQRMEDMPVLMWRKTCVECHDPVGEGTIREIPKAEIPQVWMKAAKFDHAPHQMVQCESCHTGARTSKNTSDILLPGIASCRNCHRSSGASADASCSECHVYHDWSKAKRIDGRFTVDEFSK